ncbi:enoyl-CoA hydratase/isomerase family protein [Melaminivora jejuensis]|uniref:enoyl-CoA hydratase/isomerase family protein n=1 Tax=Melaminivora jejuensis TaxID=1267217 RepID=UPI001ADFE735|nr:enoyl-CoA hydratase-related protein [Melaminivora jejuensis]UHJ66700.1 enoyl-CoA hydratase-related protein [Melaminivora jejuensis]
MTAATAAAVAAAAPLLVERQGAIATLTFNRPEALNALDVATAQALLAALQGLARDGGVRAVLLRGAGRAFVAGGDLATLRADPVQGARALLEPLNAALLVLQQLDAPVIAQVHGAAAGAGLSLMLMCDFVLAAEGTKFNLAYINLGTSCDVGASWALPRLVGLRQALEIALLGETFAADDALRLGLVNRVLPAAELDTAARAFAERIASGPTVAYGHMRRLMRTSLDRDLAAQLAAEAQSFDACARTADLREGIEAFFAKRAPQFKGR